MTSNAMEYDEQYVELAEECHSLMEQISDFFVNYLLNVEGDIEWERLVALDALRNRLKAVLQSPIECPQLQYKRP